MASMYVTDDVQEKIEESQLLLKDEVGFKPDKVKVVEKALDAYIEELQ